MICTSQGSLLRHLFYFLCSILLIHRVRNLVNTWLFIRIAGSRSSRCSSSSRCSASPTSSTMCGPTLYAARGSSSPFGPSPRTSSTHSRAGTDRVVVFVPASFIICVHIVSPIQKCRKIRGLGCVNQACTRARFTQPSPHILLHICTMIDKLIMKSCVTLAQSHLRVTKPWTRCSAHKFFRT